MKIFFRYFFMRVAQTFFIVLAACTIIWIMADLYGNMDDFLDHKVKFGTILEFYLLSIPRMLVQVLPATMLFSTLFTLLSLNRRCELVALQAGGLAPLWIFSPFLLFALLWMLILSWDLSGPAAQAEIKREHLLKQVKGQSAGSRSIFFVDGNNHVVWTIQSLDAKAGKAQNLEILQRDAEGHEAVQYCARQGQWSGQFWQLSDVKKIVYAVDGRVLDQKVYQELDLPDFTSPPQYFSLIATPPDQLTFGQLGQYIATSSQSSERLSGYRTEWWNRLLYPLSIPALIFFALIQGGRSDRRSTMTGVGVAIIVLLLYTIIMGFFLAMGQHGRLPPFLAAISTQAAFGAVGFYLLGLSNGWWWQLRDWWRKWYDVEDETEKAA